MTMSMLVRAVSFTAGLLAIVRVAGAAPTVTPSTAAAGALAVEVELADAPTSTGAVRVMLTLAGEHGCSSASTQRGPVRWDVGVCRDGGTAETPVLVFNIERADGAPPTVRVQKVRVTSRLASGRRAVVGRIAQPEGATEIAATAREP